MNLFVSGSTEKTVGSPKIWVLNNEPNRFTRSSINGSGFSVLYADISCRVSPTKGRPKLPGGSRSLRNRELL
jgi:hypothetical protein